MIFYYGVPPHLSPRSSAESISSIAHAAVVECWTAGVETEAVRTLEYAS